MLGEVLQLLGRRAALRADHRRAQDASTGHELEKYVDENTIGVVAIMGVTYTGVYEPVAEIAEALDRIQAETGLDIPIHVDGASGGMIAPFLQPELEWDFRVRARRVDQHVRAQVRPGLPRPRLGGLADGRVTCPRNSSSTSPTSAATCRASR